MLRPHQSLVHLSGFPKQTRISQKNIKYFDPPSRYFNRLIQTILLHNILYLQLIYAACNSYLSVWIIMQNLITGAR